MKLTLKNKQLPILVGILDKVQPRNMAANRGRAKLMAKAQKKSEEYAKDELDVLVTYCETDEQGRLVQLEDGSLKPREGESFDSVNQFLQDLREEEVVLKAGEYAKRYMDFLDWLATSEDDFSTDEVILIDDFLDQYESSKTNKEESK